MRRLYPFIDHGHLDCLHVVIVNSAPMNIGLQVFFFFKLEFSQDD